LLVQNINLGKFFQFSLLTAFISLFWTSYGMIVALAMIGILFVFSSKDRIRSELEKRYLWIFLISLIAIAILAISHFDLLPEYVNQYGKTLGKLFFLAIFIFVVDAVAFQFKHFGVNTTRFAKLVLWCLFASVVVKICAVFLLDPQASFETMLWGVKRDAFLAGDLNPNRADDLFLVHIAALILFGSILFVYKQLDWKTFCICLLLGVYLLLSFYVSGSRAGQFGFVVSLIAVLSLYLLKRKVLVLLGFILIFPLGIGFVISSDHPQVNSALEQMLGKKDWAHRNAKLENIEKSKSFIKQDLDQFNNMRRSDIEIACRPLTYDYHQTKHPFLSFSNSVRVALWADGTEVWLQKPLLGHGEYDHIKLVKAYDFLSKCHVLSFSHIHSFYLDLLIRGGVFALAIFVVTFIYLFYLILKHINLNHRSGLIGIAPVFYFTYLVVENLFDLTMIHNTEIMMITLLFAVICGIFFGVSAKEDANGAKDLE